MLVAMIDPAKSNKALRKGLRKVALRYHGRLAAVTCDGKEMRTRMLSLGLDPDAPLPQIAFNTRDGRQLPFPSGRSPTERAIGEFASAFLGDRLATPPPPLPTQAAAAAAAGTVRAASDQPTPQRRSERGHAGHDASSAPAASDAEDPSAADAPYVSAVTPTTFERIALDVTADVLLIVTADAACEPCARLRPYYRRAAQRASTLGWRSLTVAELDVKRHPALPDALRSLDLAELPIVLVLPAKRKEPPYAIFRGTPRPKELMYFAASHASAPFALPPNPHLTREQHAAWKEQVGMLPRAKVDKAYTQLAKETGLARDEL